MYCTHWQALSSTSRPNQAASLRLVGAIFAEQNDEWAIKVMQFMALDIIILVCYNSAFQAACRGILSVPVPPAGSLVEQNAPTSSLGPRSGKTVDERVHREEVP